MFLLRVLVLLLGCIDKLIRKRCKPQTNKQQRKRNAVLFEYNLAEHVLGEFQIHSCESWEAMRHNRNIDYEQAACNYPAFRLEVDRRYS